MIPLHRHDSTATNPRRQQRHRVGPGGLSTRWIEVLAIALTMLLAAPTTAQSPAAGVVVSECRVLAADEVRLASERSGVLAESAPAGASVAAGAVVARLRNTAANALLAIAEKEAANDIEVRFAQKAAELAQVKYDRAQDANRKVPGVVTEFELRELRLAAQKTLLQLEQAEHQFAVAALRLQEQRAAQQALQLTVPFDAFIRKVHFQPGEYVREGEVVLEVVNTDRIRIEGYIELADHRRVARGDRVSVRIAGPTSPGRTPSLAGRLVFVDVKIEPVTQKVRVTAEVDNSQGRLRDGVSATMVIHPASR